MRCPPPGPVHRLTPALTPVQLKLRGAKQQQASSESPDTATTTTRGDREVAVSTKTFHPYNENVSEKCEINEVIRK